MTTDTAPRPKSKTARKKAAQAARLELAVYIRYVESTPNTAQLRRLCRATAYLCQCFKNEGVPVTSDTTIGDLMRLMDMGVINV